MIRIPAAWHNVAEWMRTVANAVNPVLGGYPFMPLDTAPADPLEGFTYYDTALAVVRTWDGSAWQNHW